MGKHPAQNSTFLPKNIQILLVLTLVLIALWGGLTLNILTAVGTILMILTIVVLFDIFYPIFKAISGLVRRSKK